MADLVSKPGTKSVVWQYFGLKKGSGGEAIDDGSGICRSCRKTVAAKHGNTSNLLAHLRIHHGKLHAEVTAAMKRSKQRAEPVKLPANQSTLTEVVETAQSYERKGGKWKELTESVTFFLAKDGQPMYTVEKPGFRRMLKIFDARYQLPSRKYFSGTAIPNLYSSVRQKVQEELSSVDSFSGTTDLWSSVGLKPYISYTIHYIDSQWQLQSKCLQTHFLPENHTSEVLADSLMTTLESWMLMAEKQVCLTTDSGSNIVKAARDLQWPRLSCFGHNLQLAITRSLDHDPRVSRALGLARKIVSAFHCSWKRKRELSKSLLNFNIPDRSLVSVRLLEIDIN